MIRIHINQQLTLGNAHLKRVYGRVRHMLPAALPDNKRRGFLTSRLDAPRRLAHHGVDLDSPGSLVT